MQSSEVPAEAENAANAKVYISNINKNVFAYYIEDWLVDAS